jgi:hypothetical protein
MIIQQTFFLLIPIYKKFQEIDSDDDDKEEKKKRRKKEKTQ